VAGGELHQRDGGDNQKENLRHDCSWVVEMRQCEMRNVRLELCCGASSGALLVDLQSCREWFAQWCNARQTSRRPRIAVLVTLRGGANSSAPGEPRRGMCGERQCVVERRRASHIQKPQLRKNDNNGPKATQNPSV
jgi:hypothetical protein